MTHHDKMRLSKWSKRTLTYVPVQLAPKHTLTFSVAKVETYFLQVHVEMRKNKMKIHYLRDFFLNCASFHYYHFMMQV